MEHCLDGLKCLLASLLRCCDNDLHATLQGFEDPVRLARETAFSVSEIEDLYIMFKRVSCYVVDDGLMNKEEFRMALFRTYWQERLFVDRVFDLIDTEHNGVLSFEEFIRGLSVFHPRAPIDQKIDFSFKVYDLKQQGFIEKMQLMQMGVATRPDNRKSHIHEIVQEIIIKVRDKVLPTLIETPNLADNVRRDLINKALAETAIYVDKIDKEEWRNFFLGHPALLENMTFPYVQEVTFSFPPRSFPLY